MFGFGFHVLLCVTVVSREFMMRIGGWGTDLAKGNDVLIRTSIEDWRDPARGQLRSPRSTGWVTRGRACSDEGVLNRVREAATD